MKLYKHWMIYTDKGVFNGFRAFGSNDYKDIEFMKKTFGEDMVIVDEIKREESNKEETSEIGTLADYGDFVDTLLRENDNDIPTFEQYKAELQEDSKRLID